MFRSNDTFIGSSGYDVCILHEMHVNVLVVFGKSDYKRSDVHLSCNKVSGVGDPRHSA